MAEAVLTVVLENLSSLIQKQIGSVLGVEKEMEKMCSILSTISAVIEDAEERQSTNLPIKNWLQKLEDVSSELEDVLDDCEVEAFRLEESFAHDHSWIRKFWNLMLSPKVKNLLWPARLGCLSNRIGVTLGRAGEIIW
uniref:Disease resistance N-terminal domain-containing protein n=1 Tax=Cannabis sativa TaxID=3483 RepID=A0A803R2Q9_CANSA